MGGSEVFSMNGRGIDPEQAQFQEQMVNGLSGENVSDKIEILGNMIILVGESIVIYSQVIAAQEKALQQKSSAEGQAKVQQQLNHITKELSTIKKMLKKGI